MPPEDRAPYRLRLLGPWKLHGPDDREVRSVLAQPKRLCLLAYLALGGEPVSRSTLVALFWPDSDEERARNALSQSLHYLRRSLGPDVVESVEGDRVRVKPERMWFDARELLDAPEPAEDQGAGGAADRADRRSRIVEAAKRIRDGHEFFQGWNADDSQPLQSWLDDVRRRVRERAEEVVAWEEHEETASEVEDDAVAREVEDDDVAPEEPRRAAATAEGREAAYEDAGRRRRWTVWIGAGAMVGVALAVALMMIRPGWAFPGSTPPRPDEPVAAFAPTGPLEIAVLLPRVTMLDAEPSFSAEALATAVHDEMLVRLDGVQGAEVASVGFDRVAELVRSLEAQGTIDPAQGRMSPPRWVISVSIRTGGGQARVIGLLLRGPDYTLAGAVSEHEYPVPPSESVLIELPKQIAADVVEELSGAVGR